MVVVNRARGEGLGVRMVMGGIGNIYRRFSLSYIHGAQGNCENMAVIHPDSTRCIGDILFKFIRSSV